jgi:predicted Zn-dependent protease with MMP-like domain
MVGVTPDELDETEFDDLVGEALDSIPAPLARAMDNVAVVVEDWPPADQPGLLGLYEGIPLTRRDSGYFGVLPDRITIFRGPILRRCATREEVVEEVRVTVVHEVAHHFGIDDDELDTLGYG